MLLSKVIAGLTTEQIRELVAHGVPAQRVSDWRKGRRSPTPAQGKVLALVANVSPQTILDEIADIEATPEQRSFFRSVEATIATALLAVLTVILSGAPEPAKASIGAASQPVAQCDGNIHCRASLSTRSGTAVATAPRQ